MGSTNVTFTLATMQSTIDSMQSTIDAMKAYDDTFYLMVVGMIVFFMQCGFAMLEAGTVRAKNTKNILLKNLLDACFGAIIWWSFGHALAYAADKREDGYNNNGFIGTDKGGISQGKGVFFLMKFEDDTGNNYAFWWFQFVFAAAAATIVSGAMAERTALVAYVIYTVTITGLIYPVVAHWVWSTYGWISAFNTQSNHLKPFKGGCIDFAGSGVVHMTGGVAALVGAICVGPRLGRFDCNKKPCPMPGHSTTLQVLGTFILWFGWYGFNPGSTLGISPDGYSRDAARAIVTTTLSAAAGGITVVLLTFGVNKNWDVSALCNGILGGLVSITAGCSVTLPWHSFLIGITGGFVYFGVSNLILKVLKIDDPLDAFAVHGACGFWGVIMAACFAYPDYTYSGYVDGYNRKGLFYGDGKLLEAALAALFSEIAWVAGMSCMLFIPMKFAGILRVKAEVEEAGMDLSKHGGSAYPAPDKENTASSA